MMPVTKFICEECGNVKPLKDAKVVREIYMCADCARGYAKSV